MHNSFYHHPKIQKNRMIQFQENTIELAEQKDGQTLFYMTIPFQLLLGVQQVQLQ